VVVRQVLSELERMAVEYDFTAYGILHPSRAGQRTGTGSYAPAWSTRPRAIQQVMENDDGIVREVIRRSDGASGAKITLRYNAGFMEPAFEGVVGGESTLDVVTDLATKKAELNDPICRHAGGSVTGIKLTTRHLLIEEFRARTGRARTGVK